MNFNVYGWGRNDLNAMSPNDTCDRPLPVIHSQFEDKLIKTLAVGGLASESEWHVLALDNDTTVIWGFGKNTDAQVGNGANEPSSILTAIHIPAVVNTTVYKLQAGGVHSAVLGNPIHSMHLIQHRC